MRLTLILGFMMLTKTMASAAEFRYQVDKQAYVGYLAKPKQKKPAPVVLVIHEWWGQTENTRSKADKLAEAGFAALALDMYGDRKLANHPKDAGAFATAVMSDVGKARKMVDAAILALAKEPGLDMSRLNIVGYCFGGSVGLEMARQGLALKGVVAFHAGIVTPTKANAVKAKIRVFNGDADPMITKEQITQVAAEMKAANVDYEYKAIPGAKHGFTNPDATKLGKEFNLPLAFDAKADQDSWLAMLTFLRKIN